jgi:porin
MGPATLFDGHSLFIVGEVGARWTLPGARAGRLGFGYWGHTGTIDRLDGSGTVGGTNGPYLSFDQTLWKKNPDDSDDKQGLGLFLLAGYANPNVSLVNAQVSGGLQWTGLISSRPNDVAGLGAGVLCFSRTPGTGLDEDSETTVETFYRVQISPWLYVQPDLQYVHNPGGTSSQHDALAGTIQAMIDF